VSIGLIALLDDMVGLAKLAAASIDDVTSQAAKAGAKAAGVVIDDAAVTPRYVVGVAAARELPIVRRIALGSLRNKLLVLLPVALALSAFAPWAIMPLLMIGGAYLCYEGTEKLFEMLFPDKAQAHESELRRTKSNSATLEEEKIASAIKTDFILSAEIMAITLAALPATSVGSQAFTLAIVAVGITAAVYGGVAVIVKADDLGLALAQQRNSWFARHVATAVGRALVRGMPVFLSMLAVVGTAAMIWVGGGILVHGLEEYGFETIAHAINHTAEIASRRVPRVASVVAWLVTAAGSALLGVAVGAALIPAIEHVLAPFWKRLSAGWCRADRRGANS
jgi:predicted DNA repair protein MutK